MDDEYVSMDSDLESDTGTTTSVTIAHKDKKQEKEKPGGKLRRLSKGAASSKEIKGNGSDQSESEITAFSPSSEDDADGYGESDSSDGDGTASSGSGGCSTGDSSSSRSRSSDSSSSSETDGGVDVGKVVFSPGKARRRIQSCDSNGNNSSDESNTKLVSVSAPTKSREVGKRGKKGNRGPGPKKGEPTATVAVAVEPGRSTTAKLTRHKRKKGGKMKEANGKANEDARTVRRGPPAGIASKNSKKKEDQGTVVAPGRQQEHIRAIPGKKRKESPVRASSTSGAAKRKRRRILQKLV